MLPGRKSAFRLGFWPDSNRESLKICTPASVGGPSGWVGEGGDGGGQAGQHQPKTPNPETPNLYGSKTPALLGPIFGVRAPPGGGGLG